MKMRRGFVTNSSSTNDIFAALGTAGAAAFLGTIINIAQPSENTSIITYALLETLHNPEEPRPPQVRVNDNQYIMWSYAAVRCIDVMVTIDVKGKATTTVIKDEFDVRYTSAIRFNFKDEDAKWLTFSTVTGGENSMIYGEYKVCGFICESLYNDSPRRRRKAPPPQISFSISVTVADKQLVKGQMAKILDEADLYASDTTVINDSQIVSKIEVKLLHKGKYDWRINAEPSGAGTDYCSFTMEEKIMDADTTVQDLVVRPNGAELFSSANTKVDSVFARVELTGIPSSRHIPEVKEVINVTIANEGLFVDGSYLDNEGSFRVKAYIDEDAGEKQFPDIPCVFKLIVKINDAGTESTAKFADMDKAKIGFGNLQTNDSQLGILANEFKYEIKSLSYSGAYNFLPKMEIPQGKIPYLFDLPVTCEYEGKTYCLDLPVLLIGQPLGEMLTWEKEYRKLLAVIKKFMPPEDWDQALKIIEERKKRITVKELRLMQRSVWQTAQNKLLVEANCYSKMLSILDWTVAGLEWVQWVGDQAFEYLMDAYTGPVGAALLVPLKDLCTTVIGAMIGQILLGQSTNFNEKELFTGILAATFEALEEGLMEDKDKLDLKKLGKILAAFAVVKMLNHYFMDKDDEGNSIGFFDAILETFKDLTNECFKMLVSKKLEKILSSKKAKAIYEKYSIKMIEGYLDKNFKDWREDGLEKINGYVTDLIGEAGGYVYGKAIEKAGQIEIKPGVTDTIITINLYNDPINPINVDISFNSVKDKLFEYMFNSMFGMFPFATSIINPPQDPIYYKKPE